MLAWPASRRFLASLASSGAVMPAHDSCVGDGEDGWEVQEDVVVLLSNFFQDVAHLLGTKEFGWVRRDRTTGQDIKVWKYVFVDDFVKGEAHGDDVG